MRKEILASIWLLGIGCANGAGDDLGLTTNGTEAKRDDEEAGSSRLPPTMGDGSAKGSSSDDDDDPLDGGVIDPSVDASVDAAIDAPIDAPSTGACGEAACVPVTRQDIGSHFTGLGCTGIESYYTPYNGNDGIRRSWDGKGLAGTMLRTETNRSFKTATGVCTDSWPSGNTLSGFVRIYR